MQMHVFAIHTCKYLCSYQTVVLIWCLKLKKWVKTAHCKCQKILQPTEKTFRKQYLQIMYYLSKSIFGIIYKKNSLYNCPTKFKQIQIFPKMPNL